MLFEFCPQCGKKLSKKEIGDEGSIPFCENCVRPWFSFSYPCVICLVLDSNNHIALIKQSYVSDNYVCVAGYIKSGESAEQSALREVQEETGLKVASVKYINSYYYEKRDNLMLGFACFVEHADFNISNEVDSACWFDLEESRSILRQGSTAQRLLIDYLENI